MSSVSSNGRTWVLSLDMLNPTIVNFSPASGRDVPAATTVESLCTDMSSWTPT